MLAIQGLGVQVSLDGLEKRHNALRGGVPWAFASVEHFVREAVRRGARVACAMALIDQSSGEAEATCALARSWGVSSFRLASVLSEGRAVGLEGEHPQRPSSVRRLLRSLQEKYETEDFSVVLADEEAVPNAEALAYGCGTGERLWYVEPDFSVRPCPLLPETIGNLSRQTIETVRQNGARKMRAIADPSPERCGGCDRVDECKGCRAVGWAAAHGERSGRCLWWGTCFKSLDAEGRDRAIYRRVRRLVLL